MATGLLLKPTDERISDHDAEDIFIMPSLKLTRPPIIGGPNHVRSP